MLNYIRADLYRIFHQVFRYIWLVLCIALMAGLVLYSAVKKDLNAIGFAGSIHNYLFFATLIMGIGELSAVFTDDFRAKTMQIAIGSGVSRRHVVLAKLLEVTFLFLLDLLVLTLVMMVGGMVLAGITFTAHPIQQMLVEVLSFTLTASLCADVTMILLFYTQKTGFAPLLYLVLFIDPIDQILRMFASTNEFVQRLHLPDYTMTALTGTINTQLGLGASFPLKQLILMVVYLIAVYVITCAVFNKQELDF